MVIAVGVDRMLEQTPTARCGSGGHCEEHVDEAREAFQGGGLAIEA